MTTYPGPLVLWAQTGDYAGLACSEPDLYAPRRSPVYWVPITGGPVTVDVKRDDIDSVSEGDEWVYDLPTGLTMTADEVAGILIDPVIVGDDLTMMRLADLMDDEVREDVHSRLAPCTDAEFLVAYRAEHLARFGAPWLDGADPVEWLRRNG